MSSLSESIYGLWVVAAGVVVALAAASLVYRPLRTIGREPAPPSRPLAATCGWRRVLAAGADLFVLYLLYLPIDPAVSAMAQDGIAPELREAGYAPGSVEEAMARLLFFLFVSAIAWCTLSIPYRTLFEGWLGATPGKLLFGLRVRSFAGGGVGGHPGLHRAFVRTLARPLDGLPAFYALGWIVALFSPESRRIGDYLAGTVVVAPERTPLPRAGPAESEIDRRRREVGAWAEQAVHEELLSLVADGFYVFRSVPHRHFGDMDNVLVGPPGVLVVEVKGHGGEIGQDPDTGLLLRDGRPLERDVYEQVRKQAGHLEMSLQTEGFRLPVRWIVCFPRGEPVPNVLGRFPSGVCGAGEASAAARDMAPLYSQGRVAALARAVARAYGCAPVAVPDLHPDPSLGP
jgi:uncharacterized RDD family membrane protein YckC